MSGNSTDEIIELFKRDVDRTLIIASLRRTPTERILAAQKVGEFLEKWRAAGNALRVKA
jgi:hypothetical protein